MAKLSRRDLGRLAAVLAVAPGVRAEAEQTEVQSTYGGPLTGVEATLDDRHFDPVAFAHGLYASTPRQLRGRPCP